MFWSIAQELGKFEHHQRSILYYEKAINSFTGFDNFQLSRLYVELAKQFRFSGDELSALANAGRAAIACNEWREPYCEMAESYFRLNDTDAADICINIASNIQRNKSAIIDDESLYEEAQFEKFHKRIRQLSQNTDNLQHQFKSNIKILSGGDVCLARQLPGWVNEKGDEWSFKELKESLSQADMVLINLESVVSTKGDFFR